MSPGAIYNQLLAYNTMYDRIFLLHLKCQLTPANLTPTVNIFSDVFSEIPSSLPIQMRWLTQYH